MLEETMVGLYHSISTLLNDKKGKTVQFIGSRTGEGTSTLIREFAKTLAFKLEKRVLLLDADRKRPSHALAFDLTPKGGWDEAVQMGKPIKEALDQVGWSPLFVTQASSKNGSAPRVFDSAKLEALFDALKEEFDLILIDSPPATVSADALALSPVVDGVILVVEAEATRYEVAEKVVEWIGQHNVKVLGVVLNKRRYPIPKSIYRWL
jgi:capsular exopolysaccharide synthesis family protein